MGTNRNRLAAKTARVVIASPVSEIPADTVVPCNLFAREVYPMLDIVEHREDGGAGMWNISHGLLTEYSAAAHRFAEAQEAILNALKESGQTPPWPFNGYDVATLPTPAVTTLADQTVALPTVPTGSLLGLLDDDGDNDKE